MLSYVLTLQFLTDILDALFNILKNKNENLDEEVFNALVSNSCL